MVKFAVEFCWGKCLTIFPSKRLSKISLQTSPEVRHQFRRKLRKLHSGNRWCLITLVALWWGQILRFACCQKGGVARRGFGEVWRTERWLLFRCFSAAGMGVVHTWSVAASPTLRAQRLKKFKILKFSSEIEKFKRAAHQTPIFCGEFWRSGLKFSSGIEIFKRDW